MAVMMGHLYSALLKAGADEEIAKRAAEEAAGVDHRTGKLEGDVALLKWMVGTVITLQVMTLGGLIGLVWKLFPAGG